MAHRINLNEASKQELRSMEGIGGELADRIVQHRNENGRFESWNEVDRLFEVDDTRMEQLKRQAEL